MLRGAITALLYSVKWFLCVCVCIFQHGTPPLLIAAGCGNVQIIDVLMKKGAEIQAFDKVLYSILSDN